jgi:23S rRNA (pseudouridine1915-N3)-methyltransferase
MKRIRILAVGRIKTPHWRMAAEHYTQRLAPAVRVMEELVKDADPALPVETRKERETQGLLKLLKPSDTPLCLDERGKLLDSQAFAALLRALYDSGRTPCFLIGGAYGLARSALEIARQSLSLSPMTFPHELARVLLLEQLYRAENILAGTGYHH